MMMNNPQQIMIISPAERAKFDQQFIAIGPRNGLITGDQAKALFMQSGLPPADLATVWALADINRDGAMDALEFSSEIYLSRFYLDKTILVAMHLIHRRIQGNALPAVLPDSLKINPITTTAPLLVQQPMGTWPAGGAPPIAAVPVATKATNDWTLPHASKLRYSQLFNQLDKSRVGSLTGVHARNVLAQSQLPTTVLVHIWSLADVDRDGRLTVDEFCIGMLLFFLNKLEFYHHFLSFFSNASNRYAQIWIYAASAHACRTARNNSACQHRSVIVNRHQRRWSIAAAKVAFFENI
jgi:epidermal growth factor receptor substrate 15